MGRLTPDAAAALEELNELCAAAGESAAEFGVWEAQDWFGNEEPAKYGVSADMDDAALDALAERLQAEAGSSRVLVADLRSYLREVRKDLAANARPDDLDS